MRVTLINRFYFIMIFFGLFIVLVTTMPKGLAEERSMTVEGEGQFLSRPSDDSQFVKRQLYASATEDIYTKVLGEMGLDHELFWKKYNARFDEAFRATVDELKQKHSLQDEKNLEKHPKYAVYESELRDARLNQAKFGGLARSILSYSEKRQSVLPPILTNVFSPLVPRWIRDSQCFVLQIYE